MGSTRAMLVPKGKATKRPQAASDCGLNVIFTEVHTDHINSHCLAIYMYNDNSLKKRKKRGGHSAPMAMPWYIAPAHNGQQPGLTFPCRSHYNTDDQITWHCRISLATHASVDVSNHERHNVM